MFLSILKIGLMKYRNKLDVVGKVNLLLIIICKL